MSHSGSSEYPLPLTGPSSTSVLSNSQVEQQRVFNDSRGVNSSTKSVTSSSSKDSVRESIKIYSVQAHKDHKRRSSRQNVNEKNRINNNHNIEQVIVIIWKSTRMILYWPKYFIMILTYNISRAPQKRNQDHFCIKPQV